MGALKRLQKLNTRCK